MSKKRFLYVGGFQLPDKNGAAHRVLSIAKILNKLDYSVVFLDVDEELQGCELSKMHIEEGFPTYSQGRPKGIKKWIQYVLNPLHVEEVLAKYDDWEGVIAYNYPAMALYKLKKLCKKRNVKVFADCTEWYQLDYVKSVRDIALLTDTFFRMRVVHKILDGMIGISSFLGNYYRDSLTTIVIPPLIDRNELKWEKNPSFGQNKGLQLAYVGSPGVPGQMKDKLDSIVRAVCKCNSEEIKLNVVGITKEQYMEYYPKDISLLKSPAGKHIAFWGRMDHLKALDVIKKCDYTVFFRAVTKVSTAGFPTKFVESISCGVPVITNETSDLSQYIRSNMNGFLLNTNSFEEDLEKLLNYLSTDTMLRPNVDENIFDYRNYIERIEIWLKKCKL